MTYSSIPISQAFEIISGGTPKRSMKEYWNGDIPWISIKDFNDEHRYILNTVDFITNKGLKNSSTNMLEKNDIIISARGTVGKINMIRNPMAFNQSCYGLRVKEDLEANYGYFAVKNSIRELKSQAHGSVFSTIIKNTFDNIKIPKPTFKEQKIIGNILSSLDDKIEINNAIIANLEEQAQVIFKSWFVDFEPFQDNEFKESELGIIPELFTVKTLKEISMRRNGYTYKSTELDDDSNINMITLKNFNRNGGINFSNTKPIVETERIKGFHYLNNEDILIACTDLTQNAEVLGRTLSYFKNEDYDKEIYSMDLVKIEPNDVNDQIFIYYYLNSSIFKSFAEGVATGTTVLHLPKRSIDDFKLLYPTNKAISKFNDLVRPMLLKQNQLILQNKKLKKIQVTLLPKLMSGEIRVEEAVETE